MCRAPTAKTKKGRPVKAHPTTAKASASSRGRANLTIGTNAVHGDAAEKLGVEVGGLLRHDFAGRGDFHDLVNGARIQKKRDLSAAGINSVKREGGFALVGEMRFRGDGLRGDAESGLEDSFV